MPARAIDANGNVTDVTLKDLSATGARIEAPYGASLPRRFVFSAPREKIDTPAEIVWRRGFEAGLRFVSNLEEEPAPAKTEPAAPIARPKLEDLRKLARTVRR